MNLCKFCMCSIIHYLHHANFKTDRGITISALKQNGREVWLKVQYPVIWCHVAHFPIDIGRINYSNFWYYINLFHLHARITTDTVSGADLRRLQTSVASFTKEVNPRLAKRPLKTNGRLANRSSPTLLLPTGWVTLGGWIAGPCHVTWGWLELRQPLQSSFLLTMFFNLDLYSGIHLTRIIFLK